MEKFTNADGKEDMRGYPFVVPGGRFNELYGTLFAFAEDINGLLILCRLGQLYDVPGSHPG